VLNWPIPALLLAGAAVIVLVSPLVVSIWLQHLATRCAVGQERTKWVGEVRWSSPLMILVAPAWWSLSTFIRDPSNTFVFTTAVPLWILLLIPPSLSMLVARFCRTGLMPLYSESDGQVGIFFNWLFGERPPLPSRC